MTPKEVARKMLIGNLIWAMIAVVGIFKSVGFISVVPLCLSLAVTFFLMWLAKRKGRSVEDKNAEER